MPPFDADMHSSDDRDEETQRLPMRLQPMMLAHYALTGDDAQRREWLDRIEAIHQMEAVETAQDPEIGRLLQRRRVWERMRVVGKTGAAAGLALGSVWMSWLLPVYAIGHGFGWPAALAYLLPVPLAWKIGRRLWERASVAGMRDLGWRPSLAKRMSAVPRAAVRAMIAGYGFGFSLIFLQGLISWFMTPAPTIGAELLWDFTYGALGGLIGALGGLPLTPMISKTAP